MARKGNQQKSGTACQSSNRKKKVPDSGSPSPGTRGKANAGEVKVSVGVEILVEKEGRSPTEKVVSVKCVGNEEKNTTKCTQLETEGQKNVPTNNNDQEQVPNGGYFEDIVDKISATGSPHLREKNESIPSTSHSKRYAKSSQGRSQNGLHMENGMEKLSLVGRNFRYSALSTLKAVGLLLYAVVNGTVRTSALSIMKVSADWLERQKPSLIVLKTNFLKARDHVQTKFRQAYPIVLRWIIHIGNIMFLIAMVWLDCTLRGIDSFIHMGTTSFFLIIWCSVLSLIAMCGFLKFLMVLAIAALAGVFLGLTLAILVIAISGIILLWFYGSFWTTLLVVFIAGLPFLLSQERFALLVATVYALYCCWAYNGWTGLLLGLNASFISSDLLVYFLKDTLNEHIRADSTQDQADRMRGRPGFFHNDSTQFSSSGPGAGESIDRSPGIPSTSGVDIETTSEDEVIRLLNCSDHYSALGLSRFENVDVSLLKREYKKKAMLVHPDKNMGNDKAAEAFKKLQNAYEILLDSIKRQAYDDELRREELLNYFRHFQTASRKRGGNGLFTSGSARSEADGEDLLGESRRIACKKCGNLHIWILTKKSKSRARWCQDCKDFHQAKDGDGWVEQSMQPFLFGLLQKVDVPCAYVCAESRIYDATDWYICQGMRCPANTHKPSFHVNTSITSKPGGRGNTSGHRGGIPAFNMEETMTEDEIYEWLQNAMQTGMFAASDGTTSAPSPPSNAEGSSKSGGSNSGSGSRKKRKGKKQR